jgi:lipoate-protein ligase A
MGMTGDQLLAWWDDAASGALNMAADEMLAAEAARRGQPLIRFYGWDSPTVSLGGFQAIAAARSIPAIAAAPVVRRPSGGGALVHGTDLTYALAVPRGHAWARSPLPLYDAVHEALVAVLDEFGVVARRHPGRPASLADPFFCFSRRASGDVVAARPGQKSADDDPKILGSAQRRLAAAVVQHGSLLLTSNPGVGADARHPGLAEVGGGVCLGSLRGVAESWTDRIAAAGGLGVAWQPAPFATGREAELASALPRYREARWLERR